METSLEVVAATLETSVEVAGCGVGDLLGDGVDAALPSNTLSSYRAL